jgi:hypothetical protein
VATAILIEFEALCDERVHFDERWSMVISFRFAELVEVWGFEPQKRTSYSVGSHFTLLATHTKICLDKPEC